ncbi:MAG: ATP-binding cassette domain-containing protein [Dehalococcoidales bacterium]|nr:ATP-binding cassette domain-containing protein [Dehalococcoidales bacterium]
MSIIQVENLQKIFRQRKGREGMKGAMQDLFKREYRIVHAVNSISFSVDEGEIVGYIGPNGAGKSTTIKMLVGILVPSGGNVTVNGLIPFKNREKNAKRIGVVFGQRTQLWWDIPVSETLSLMRYIYKVTEEQYSENLKIFGDILGLDEFINAPVRQLSLGQRMRADICCALLHNPDILYLDEPTIGLDVVVKERIREFVKEINRQRGTTVILATHDMSDIERLSSRVMVINYGDIMYDGSLNSLRRKYGTEETVTADILGEINDINGLHELGVSDVNYEENKITIKYDTEKINSSAVVGWLMDRTETKDINVAGTQIEDVIRRMYLIQGQNNLS